MKRLIAIALLLGASCSGDPAPTRPEAFALSVEVTPAPGALVQQVGLPAKAIIALKRGDRGDIRIFDSRGKPLSIARLSNTPANFSIDHFDAIPFNAQARAEAGSSVSVSVTQGDHAVTVDTGGQREAPESSVLIDTRRVKEPAVNLTLDATLPQQRPVTMSLKAGSDLKAWEPVAEQVLFRPGDDTTLLGSGAIDLHGEKLEGRYLLVSWSSSAGASVTGAVLFTTPTPPPSRIAVPTNGLKVGDGHTMQFTMPPGPAPAAMRLAMTGNDGVVPVSLFGRNTAEHPWTPLAVGVLRQEDGAATLNSTGSFREYKLEADARSAGFSQAPRLEFQYEPISLLVAFNGAGPYKLAVGNAAAKPAFLTATYLTTQKGPYATARVNAGRDLTPIQLQAANEAAFNRRKLLLWGTLLLGVAVLAAAAYWLMRTSAKPTE